MSFVSAAGIDPFSILAPAGDIGPLVFASPHSGTARPDDFGSAQGLTEASLRSAEDVLVDRLIDAAPRHGVPVIAGRISRAYVDLNRGEGELDSSLIADLIAAGPLGAPSVKTAAGFGVIPRRAGDGADLYHRSLSLDEARARLEAVHRPYHHALAGLMAAAATRRGVAILVDWHSMPSRATGGRAMGGAAAGRRSLIPGADVVLGDRHGTACDRRLTRRLRELFEAAGWRVALNQPYAGGYSTQRWGRPAEGRHAIQIELNRGLYLDEKTLEPTADFTACKAVLDRVIAALSADEGSWIDRA